VIIRSQVISTGKPSLAVAARQASASPAGVLRTANLERGEMFEEFMNFLL